MIYCTFQGGIAWTLQGYFHLQLFALSDGQIILKD